MLVVVALGGNALLRRGQPLRAPEQLDNVRRACAALAPLAREHRLVITHGNGPQVGLLALQDDGFPLDVLNAETEGMIGYLIERELGNLLPHEQRLATLLTMVEVGAEDPAFGEPTKPIGPMYTESEARALAKANGWVVKRDGDGYRRVVASPQPRRIIEIEPIRWLLERDCVVVCAGGGGIPIVRDADGIRVDGVAAVIDKDHASALLASELDADLFVMATDVDGVYLDWGEPSQRRIVRAHPDALRSGDFAAGSMAPKIEAARSFVERTGRDARIGALDELDAIVAGTGGTVVSLSARGLELAGDVEAAYAYPPTLDQRPHR
jgi:carbamate kinase